MTTETEKKEEHNGSIVDSTVELGVAATKFAMDQLETALCAVGSPGKAMDRIKRSIDQFTDAMNASVEPEKAEKTAHASSGVEAARKVEREPEKAEEEEEAGEEAAGEAAFTGRKT